MEVEPDAGRSLPRRPHTPQGRLRVPSGGETSTYPSYRHVLRSRYQTAGPLGKLHKRLQACTTSLDGAHVHFGRSPVHCEPLRVHCDVFPIQCNTLRVDCDVLRVNCDVLRVRCEGVRVHHERLHVHYERKQFHPRVYRDVWRAIDRVASRIRSFRRYTHTARAYTTALRTLSGSPGTQTIALRAQTRASVLHADGSFH